MTHCCQTCGNEQRNDWHVCLRCGKVIRNDSLEQRETDHELWLNRVEDEWERLRREIEDRG